MAEDSSSPLHIDTDWKKQAQEEKRRLAEEQAKRAAASPPPPVRGAGGGGGRAAPAGRGTAGAERGMRREPPQASFPTLVQSLLTQALLYLGDLAMAGNEPMVDLDRAKHQLDTLAMLEEKTANNLNDEERRALDRALYEAQTRFVSVASQYL